MAHLFGCKSFFTSLLLRTLLKFGYQFANPGFRMSTSNILTRNTDEVRKKRVMEQKKRSQAGLVSTVTKNWCCQRFCNGWKKLCTLQSLGPIFRTKVYRLPKATAEIRAKNVATSSRSAIFCWNSYENSLSNMGRLNLSKASWIADPPQACFFLQLSHWQRMFLKSCL